VYSTFFTNLIVIPEIFLSALSISAIGFHFFFMAFHSPVVNHVINSFLFLMFFSSLISLFASMFDYGSDGLGLIIKSTAPLFILTGYYLGRFRLNVLYTLLASEHQIIPRSDIELEILSRFSFNDHLIEQIDAMFQDCLSGYHSQSAYAFLTYATFTFCIKGLFFFK
jgi:hypothetical protein